MTCVPTCMLQIKKMSSKRKYVQRVRKAKSRKEIEDLDSETSINNESSSETDIEEYLLLRKRDAILKKLKERQDKKKRRKLEKKKEMDDKKKTDSASDTESEIEDRSYKRRRQMKDQGCEIRKGEHSPNQIRKRDNNNDQLETNKEQTEKTKEKEKRKKLEKEKEMDNEKKQTDSESNTESEREDRSYKRQGQMKDPDCEIRQGGNSSNLIGKRDNNNDQLETNKEQTEKTEEEEKRKELEKEMNDEKKKTYSDTDIESEIEDRSWKRQKQIKSQDCQESKNESSYNLIGKRDTNNSQQGTDKEQTEKTKKNENSKTNSKLPSVEQNERIETSKDKDNSNSKDMDVRRVFIKERTCTEKNSETEKLKASQQKSRIEGRDREPAKLSCGLTVAELLDRSVPELFQTTEEKERIQRQEKIDDMRYKVKLMLTSGVYQTVMPSRRKFTREGQLKIEGRDWPPSDFQNFSGAAKKAHFQFIITLICERHKMHFDLVERVMVELNFISLTEQVSANTTGALMVKNHTLLKNFMNGTLNLTPTLEELFNFWYSLLGDRRLPRYVTDIRNLLDAKGIKDMYC